MREEEFDFVNRAVDGDKQALEALIMGVEDMIYNLSLRMLGTTQDAEDAVQEIIIRIITQLSTFRKESAFSTWVYRIAVNYLINYKKSMFAQRPLSFEFYGMDIDNGFIENKQELLQDVSEDLLTEELKLSCTNVMLQCLDPESRCIYVLGVMFRADSKVCGEILGISPEAYRQRLSRVRKKMGGFLDTYCGLSEGGKCSCRKRVGYAIQNHRLDPHHLEYTALKQLDYSLTFGIKQSMEKMDDLSLIFRSLPKFRSPDIMKEFLKKLIVSEHMSVIKAV
ncbi:RNA polymerase sigma factor [Anoxybacterium hadale]|uniref:RNA polymerase sigma factor n=1 Tax=Anoxybacterium hadale TaxID=3408580 RepID=A0ACD1A9H6_9FIRM|nr:RNA polymerase sigma factor [Clostridiales bacterium]